MHAGTNRGFAMTQPTPEPLPRQQPPLEEPEALSITADMLAPPPPPVETRIDFERGMSVVPLLSLALIAANVAVFVWEVVTGALESEGAITRAGALHRASVLHGEVWRLPWSMFLHGSVAHLL